MYRASGFYIIALMLVLTLVAGVVLRYSSELSGVSHNQAQKTMSTQAYFAALSGLEVGTFSLNSPLLTSANSFEQRKGCLSIANTFNLDNASIDVGMADFRDVSTKITASVSSTSSVLPVQSLNGFSEKGRVVVNQEAIDYLGTSTSSSTCSGQAPCLIYLKRGVDGTSAKFHANQSVVSQYQCEISSVASVPNHQNPQAQRTLKQTVQLQKAWLGGKKDSQNGVVGSWDGVTWSQESGIPKEDIYDIVALTYKDVRAVGKKGTILHYNGSSWVDFSSSSINKDILGISCARSDDCWAVGKQARFYHFNGNSWSYIEKQGNQNIHAIHCLHSQFCWAVGKKGLVYRFPASSGTGQWSMHTTPTNEDLNGIMCLSENNCWAVGDSSVILKWNGSNWTVFKDVGNTDIFNIHCLNAQYCWAVGDDKNFWLFNGVDWVLTTPSAIPNNTYSDVRCYRSNDCWAVGDSSSGNALMVHWDGFDWSRIIDSDVPNKDLYALDVVGSKGFAVTYNDDVIR